MIIVQDQDSWGHGTNGTTSQPVKIGVLDNLPARRSVHKCNGAKCCKLFNKEVLTGCNYVREDPYDLSVMHEIFAGEQKQNELDGATVVAMTEV